MSGAKGNGVGWEVKCLHLGAQKSVWNVNKWTEVSWADLWRERGVGLMYLVLCGLSPQIAIVVKPRSHLLSVKDAEYSHEVYWELNCFIMSIWRKKKWGLEVSCARISATWSRWQLHWLSQGDYNGRTLPCQTAKQFIVFLIPIILLIVALFVLLEGSTYICVYLFQQYEI
jgi:hypothetical protein